MSYLQKLYLFNFNTKSVLIYEMNDKLIHHIHKKHKNLSVKI